MLQMLAFMMSGQSYAVLQGPLTPESTHASLARQNDRPLEVRVTYPREQGSYPVILFSHGLRGSMDSYDPLIKSWVSHGYVCIQPNHADSYLYYKGNPRQMFQINAQSVGNWKQRPQEISMIIDRLPEIEKQVPGLSARVQPGVIGVAGHSFGAHTSALIAGARPATGESFKDKRPLAVLLISPQGQGNGFRSDAWKDMAGPVMDITGSEDVSIVPTTPQLRRMPFDKSPAGNKYLLWIEGAHHGMGGITGRWFPTAGPADPVILNTVETVSLAYWDAYLKHSPQAKQFLASEQVKNLSKGLAHIERR